MGQRELLSKLVSHLLLAQEGDGAHANGVRACEAVLQQQRLLGAAPDYRLALEELDELQERLSISAQHSRAAALAQLRVVLSEQLHAAAQLRNELGVELPADVPPPGELCGSILCLLVRLAGRPGSVQLREPQLAGIDLGSSRPGSAASAHVPPNDASDSASIASTDTLSHWTSSDEEEPVNAEPRSDAQSSSDAGDPGQWEVCHLLPGITPLAEPSLLPPPSSKPADLASRVAALRGDAPQPPVQGLISEHAAVAQILHCLRGVVTAGPVLQLSAGGSGPKVEPVPGAHVPELSIGALHALLQRFAAIASAGLRVRRFVASALTPQPAQASRTPAPRAAAAVAAAMQRQLHELDALLLALQEDWLHQRHPHTEEWHAHAPPLSTPGVTAAAAGLTLMRLDAETCGVASRLLLLAAVTEAIAAPAAASHEWAGPGTELPAAAAARVVNGLQALLAPPLLRGGPQSCCEAAVLIELLSAALAPLLAHLQRWLADGLLDDPCSDFFVAAGEGVNVASPDFWRKAFRLRHSASPAADAAPAFLIPLADDILTAGKARILLQHERATATSAAADAVGSSARSAAAGEAAGRPDGSSASDAADPRVFDLAWQCAQRLRKALLAQLDGCAACRDGCTSGSGGGFGVPGDPMAVRMASTAAQSCISPALAEEPAPSTRSPMSTAGAAPAAELPAGACRQQTSDLVSLWPPGLPASGWGAPLQQLHRCLPPLLPTALPTALLPVSLLHASNAGRGCGTNACSKAAISSHDNGLQHASVEQLLQTCVLAPVQQQISVADAALLCHLRSNGVLGAQLAALRGLFLLAAPAAADFASGLFALLDAALAAPAPTAAAAAGGEAGAASARANNLLADSPAAAAARLRRLLTATLGGAGSGSHPVPPVKALTVHWGPAPAEARQGGAASDVAALSRLRLDCRIGGAAAVLLTPGAVQQYGAILSALLQVRWALAGLQALQPRWAAPSAAAAALRQEMLHFVAGLHAWSLHALLETAWRRLQQDLRQAATLAEVAAAHAAWLGRAASRAFAPPDPGAHLLQGALAGLLGAVRQFTLRRAAAGRGLRQAALTSADAEAGRAFRRHRAYFCKVLRARTREGGGDAELRHLLNVLQGEA